MLDLIEPKEKLSKNGIIDEAERHSNEKGSIAFARGVRWAIKLILPMVNDYNRQRIKRLIE